MRDDQAWNIGEMITDSGKRKHWVRNPVKMLLCTLNPTRTPLSALRNLFIGWAAVSFWLRVKSQNLSLLLSRYHIVGQPMGHRKGSGFSPIVIIAVVMMDETAVVQGPFPHANYFSTNELLSSAVETGMDG